MAVQHETIELLHLMGATNADIAHQFQNHIRALSWPAASAGYALALATIGLLAYFFNRFGAEPLTFSWTWLLFGGLTAFVPLAAALVATVTARLSVLSLLRRLP
ncbi:MAG: FtsX-like permease family protein [Alphaproteobacteria bacterium]|nr:FtsX-like permease family protein [Alphaproteobacteria bacterium]